MRIYEERITGHEHLNTGSLTTQPFHEVSGQWTGAKAQVKARNTSVKANAKASEKASAKAAEGGRQREVAMEHDE